MKIKNIFMHIGVTSLAVLTLYSCNDLLDTKSYTQSNTQNFPSSMDDVNMLVTSMYANLNHQAAHPESSYLLTNLFASDDMFAGTSNGAADHLMVSGDTDFDFLWDIHYKGINAANMCLEGLDHMEQTGNLTDKAMFDQQKGEALFMRAYQYYELAELFGGVPLITSTTLLPLLHRLLPKGEHASDRGRYGDQAGGLRLAQRLYQQLGPQARGRFP